MRWLGVKSSTIPTARELLRLVYVGRMCLAIAIYITTALKIRVAAPPDILASSLMLVTTVAVTIASYWHTHFRGRLPGPTFLYLQAVFDVLLITAVVPLTGGAGCVLGPAAAPPRARGGGARARPPPALPAGGPPGRRAANDVEAGEVR